MARIAGIQKSISVKPSLYLSNLEESLVKEYQDLLEQEEIFWKQKSRNSWLIEGDKNTRFFHSSTVIMRRRNKIERLKKKNSLWIKDTNGMKEEAVGYFRNLFEEKHSTGEYVCLPQLFLNLNPSDIAGIGTDVSEQEVKQGLFSIGGFKAPGPDGFPAVFFQKI